jgi:hypothetical protein
MTTSPVIVIRHTLTTHHEPQHMIDRQSAMRLCERHFARTDSGYVQIDGQFCWNMHQAELRIIQHFCE